MAGLKRFYKEVQIAPAETVGWRLQLDARPVKTSAQNSLNFPTRALVEAAAAEWSAQEEEIDFAAMPITRLSMGVVDHIIPRMADIRAEVLNFSETDLLCYRASDPEALVVRQQGVWQPYLDWLTERHGITLQVAAGVLAIRQEATSLEALAAIVEGFEAGELLVLHGLTHRFGSIVLALSVLDGTLAAEAFAASRLDEEFQIEQWGEDEEARARAARVAHEVADLERFLKLLRMP